MDLLAREFDAITFRDVVEFCDQKVVENAELDYKQVLPRDISKHFAAMSNRYGGLIIVGVTEDSNGKPVTYEGIVDDGKQIDRVHQIANTVRPLPTYQVRTTDKVNGKVFLLIRIHEGGVPPYRVGNDPTIYLRTGNVTTRISLVPADAEVVRDLYAKRTGAEKARQANIDRAKAVLPSLFEQADVQRRHRVRHEKRVDAELPFQLPKISDDFRMITGYLQPFYPGRELALPRVMNHALSEIRVINQRGDGREFPSLSKMDPMARGMCHLSWDGRSSGAFSADQVHANGFFWHSEHSGVTRREQEAENIYLSDIARVLYTTLLFGRKFYRHFEFSGLTLGAIELAGARGRPVLKIASDHWPRNFPLAIDAAYRWPIEADTHQLADDGWLRDYFYRTMREVYWDLGIENVTQPQIDGFLDESKFA